MFIPALEAVKYNVIKYELYEKLLTKNNPKKD